MDVAWGIQKLSYPLSLVGGKGNKNPSWPCALSSRLFLEHT